jgi:hypothetical protein
MAERPSVVEAAVWVVAVTVGERQARRAIGGRAAALLATYVPLGVVAALRSSGPRNVRPSPRWALPLGIGLTFGGYQLGRWLLGDQPTEEPSDPFVLELLSLGVLVPVAEEMIWGARVEPAVGVGVTACVFAGKHPSVDDRWRRTLGLAAFWAGLGLIRRRSRLGAVVAHVIANSGAVALGHATGRDRY